MRLFSLQFSVNIVLLSFAETVPEISLSNFFCGEKTNVEFFFQDLEKFYVDQINIFGNYVTDEKVIRNNQV